MALWTRITVQTNPIYLHISSIVMTVDRKSLRRVRPSHSVIRLPLSLLECLSIFLMVPISIILRDASVSSVNKLKQSSSLPTFHLVNQVVTIHLFMLNIMDGVSAIVNIWGELTSINQKYVMLVCYDFQKRAVDLQQQCSAQLP